MKYFLLGLFFTVDFAFLCCSPNQTSTGEDIDTCNLDMTDSYAVVYNIATHKNETLKISRKEEGDIKILSNGDTLFWIEGDRCDKGEYVSHEEWLKYFNMHLKNHR